MEGVECETDGGQKEPMEPRPSTLAGTRPSAASEGRPPPLPPAPPTPP